MHCLSNRFICEKDERCGGGFNFQHDKTANIQRLLHCIWIRVHLQGFHIGAWRVWYFLLPPPHQLWGHKGRLELGHLPGWLYSSLFPFPHPSQWMTIDRHSDHKDDRCRRRGNTSRSATCSSREDRHSLSQNRFDCIECTGLMKIMKKRGLFDLDDGGGDRYQGLAPSSARTRCLRMRGKCAGVLLDRSTIQHHYHQPQPQW